MDPLFKCLSIFGYGFDFVEIFVTKVRKFRFRGVIDTMESDSAESLTHWSQGSFLILFIKGTV